LKWIVKLDEHIKCVQEVINGEYKIVDVDGNELFYSNQPDYILCREKNTDGTICGPGLNSCLYVWYFYPRYFDKYRDEYYIWYCSSYDLENILSDVEKEEKINVLSINEIQNRLHKNRKSKAIST